jgi:hypothetical protein
VPASQHGTPEENGRDPHACPGRGHCFFVPTLVFRATLFPVERGTVVYEETLVEQETLRLDDDAFDGGDWFCVRTDPFPCPADGCTYVATFMTAAHLILVWETQDDPNLLKHAARARDVGRNPRIVGYEPDYGPSASYYAWIAAGRPVHGVRAQ